MTIKRKVEYFELKIKDIDSARERPFKALKTVLESAIKLDFQSRKWEPNNNKFVYLDSISSETDIQSGYITCGLTKYRPDLVNGIDGEKRENPKKDTEGDEERVHFAIKYNSNRVVLLVENNGRAVQPERIGYYFCILSDKVRESESRNRVVNIVCEPIPIDNMIDVINNMNKATLVELFYDKKILGSSFLNLTQRSGWVRQEVVITIKTTKEKSSNIRETAQDIFHTYGSNPDVKRVRVSGRDNNDTPFQVDTSFFEKKTYISIEEDLSKGTVNSTDALRKLKELSRNI